MTQGRRQPGAARAQQQQHRPQAGGGQPGPYQARLAEERGRVATRRKAFRYRDDRARTTAETNRGVMAVRAPSQGEAATAPKRAAITATGQASGTKAAAIAVSRPGGPGGTARSEAGIQAGMGRRTGR